MKSYQADRNNSNSVNEDDWKAKRKFKLPSQIVDNMFVELQLQVEELEAKVLKLEKENMTLRDQSIKYSQEMSARTLQIALSGGFDNMNKSELEQCGYNTVEKK